MRRALLQLWNDDRGFLLTMESIFLASILVIGLVVGLTAVRTAISLELEDVANAFSINQSYSYGGVTGCCAFSGGSSFTDIVRRTDLDTCVPASGDTVEGCEDDGTVPPP